MDEGHLSNLERVMIRCYEDYHSFRKYKEGRFFDQVLNGNAKEIERKKVLKMIKDDLDRALMEHRRANQRYKDSKM